MIAPVFGSGRGLKLPRFGAFAGFCNIAPVFGSGRGLKLERVAHATLPEYRPGLRIGARIETLSPDGYYWLTIYRPGLRIGARIETSKRS